MTSQADKRVAAVPRVVWTWARLPRLSPDDIYDLLALRAEVFVMEQRCAFLDPDGLDHSAWHLLGRTAADANPKVGEIVAYLRVLDPGVKYREASIGRVVTRATARGVGLGRALLREGLARAMALWPAHAIRIGAQLRLEAFYRSLGFTAVGGVYVEDAIDHIEMIHAARDASGDPASDAVRTRPNTALETAR